jgi:hypothetical protein
MVEIRKVLDHEQSSMTYPALKFYADWMVHTRKDYVGSEMRSLITKMYRAALDEIRGFGVPVAPNAIRDFAYMEGLKTELSSFLGVHAIQDTLTTAKPMWVAFVALMVKVLENQPIVAPTPDVAELILDPANVGCVIARMTFNNAVDGNTYYRLMSAY